jgi:hypothetical protein
MYLQSAAGPGCPVQEQRAFHQEFRAAYHSRVGHAAGHILEDRRECHPGDTPQVSSECETRLIPVSDLSVVAQTRAEDSARQFPEDLHLAVEDLFHHW